MSDVSPVSSYSSLVNQIFDNLDVRAATRYEYKIRIKHFLAFIETPGLNLNTFLEYKRFLAANTDYSVATKNKYLTCARQFMRECHRLGLLPRDITTNVRSFKQTQQHKLNGLNDADVYLICQWVKAHPYKLREHALLSLLLFQGLRQAEICQITLGDVNLDDQTLFIFGKGRDDKERVHLHPETARALSNYIDSKTFDEASPLFTAQKLTSGQAVKLTERGLRYIVKSIFAEVGIKKNIHGFRHYFTTKLIKSMPGQLTNVAQFTRHRSLSMLSVYNDAVLQENDLPTFYATFDDVDWPKGGYSSSLQYVKH